MSRSRKKAIFKGGGEHKRRTVLRRQVKRSQKNFLRSNFDDIASGDKVIPDENSIVNPYNYCDYVYDCEHVHTDPEWKEKLSRK